MSKIYIIDDDRNIVESLSIVLKSAGHEVSAQYDEQNTANNVDAFGADLIILDVMFPENDGAGFEIAREIKHNEQTKNIPILMLSAVNEKGEYAGTFSNRDKDESWLPVNDFVEKPINPKVLLEKIKTILKKD